MTKAASTSTAPEIATRPHFSFAAPLLALGSGMAALVYEVLWMRQLTVFLGATAIASAATLSAMFLGSAIGSAVIGARSTRWTRRIRAYGLLETGIGLSALLIFPVLGLYERLYGVLYPVLLDHAALGAVTKIILAVAALFIPSFLMGGTLCLLGEAFIPSAASLGVAGSGLYAANTLGATLGALSVPFLLLPRLGVNLSYFVAIAASLLVGAAACWLDRVSPPSLNPLPAGAGARPRRETASGRRAREVTSPALLALMAFLSGAFVLALEVLWTEMLAQVHENSIYSFAIVVAVFLFGLALGAVLSRLLLLRGFRPRRTLGMVWIVSGLLVAASPLLFFTLSRGLRYVNELGPHPEWTTLGLAAITMLLPTLLAGMVLPLLMQVIGQVRDGAPGPLLGRLLAINTAGAIVAPLLATFVLLPLLGLWVSITLIGVLMIFTGELVARRSQGAGSPLARRFAVAAVLAVMWFAASPLSLPAVRFKREGNEKLLHLAQGSSGIVAVVESPHERWMLLNNFYVLGGTESAVDERQQARIPLLLHPAPRRVAVLGLGTGITAGGALLPAVEKIDAVEMVPEVTAAARVYFSDANLGLLRDPRVRVVNEDARVFLQRSGQSFDVIIGDLVVPWRNGEAALFSREHFAAAHQALAPGGIFCVWLPMFQLSREQFQIIAATFMDIFPDTTLWRGDFLPNLPAIALIGHTAPLDMAAVDERVRRLGEAQPQVNPVVSSPGGLWLYLVGPLNPRLPEFASARRNLMSRPWIELLSPQVSLDEGRGPSAAFSGQSLTGFLETVRAAPLEGTVLAGLDAAHKQWRESGSGLWQACVLLDQGEEQKANQSAIQSIAALPAELQSVLLGPQGLSGVSSPSPANSR